MNNFTDTSEEGLQNYIVKKLVEEQGYVETRPKDLDLEFCVNKEHLFEFIKATQPETYAYLQKGNERSFLARLNKKIAEKGVVDVLRKGINFYDKTVKLFYTQPASNLNPQDQANYASNIFAVTKEQTYSTKHNNEIDLVIFINGIPVITAELKNPLTNQTYLNAIKQYRTDRDPNDALLNFARCLVHFAVDTNEVYMTTHLNNQATRFLPFNKGLNNGTSSSPFGKGNPENKDDLKISYLWSDILTKDTLSTIIAKYAQLVTEPSKTGKGVKKKLIFPRYHQLTAVRKLLAHTKEYGVGKRYLIQHSTGSGKSFTIVWLAYQLANLYNESGTKNFFNSVIIVTDRRNLDENIREQLKTFGQVKYLVEAIDGRVGSKSDQLKEALLENKKVIVVTVQTFPFVLEKIQSLPDSTYAIIIDEAHSSQSGAAAAQMNAVLSNEEVQEIQRDEEGNIQTEDYINALIKSRRMLSNASYYAFTATPKNKTLETFGNQNALGQYCPFHLYPMKQAIEEGFIIDVLQSYTTYTSYYKITKTIEANPEFDVKKANKQLRSFVEAHPETIAKKAKIMINHFNSEVAHLIDGQARAMVVTKSISSAIKYKDAFDDYLKQIKSPYKAIVAFSGSKKHYKTGEELTEVKMNNFSNGVNDIPQQFKNDPYRFLIVAEKFQTGYDEPLLHTMYVDKHLAGLQAVQTLSRLNRAYPGKQDAFVLDFYNEAEEIKEAFEPYYTSTLLSETTDPNKLNDLQEELDETGVYSREDVDRYFEGLVSKVDRGRLEAQLDGLCAVFNNLQLEQKIKFKANARGFVRTYNYLSKIIDFEKVYWEKLYWLLKSLTPKLRVGEDEPEESILQYVDIDSVRPAKKAKSALYLDDEGSEVAGIVIRDAPIIQTLSPKDTLENILSEFNKRFGNIDWKEPGKVKKALLEDIPALVQNDSQVKNAPDRQNAKEVTNRKLKEEIKKLMTTQTEIYKKYMEDKEFQEKYRDFVFDLVWRKNQTGNYL